MITFQGGAYFPFQYYCDFLQFVCDHRNLIQIITYDDLAWGRDYDYEHNYPGERQDWQRQLENGEIDPNKIYVLLQHDADTRPERTLAVLREEHRRGIRSNVMIFSRRVDRRHMRTTGELRYTEYDLDYGYLARLEAKDGFVIGYHSNAYEQALFDIDKAEEIFEHDVAVLRKHFEIRYFSAHGGTPGPTALNNRNVPIPKTLRESIKWVCNGGSPWFSGHYSDGGINSPKRDPEKRDMRDFVKTWNPGHRYRVLTHPQYYGVTWRQSPRLKGTRWYQEVLAQYEARHGGSAWDEVAQHFEGHGHGKGAKALIARVGQLFRFS